MAMMDDPVISVKLTRVHSLLAQLGVTANYKGFRQSAYAIYLGVQEPERLALVTKWLYPAVAARYSSTWLATERNIRTAAAVAWKNNPRLLSELAGYTLDAKPTAAQFISILVYFFLNEGDGQDWLSPLCKSAAVDASANVISL